MNIRNGTFIFGTSRYIAVLERINDNRTHIKETEIVKRACIDRAKRTIKTFSRNRTFIRDRTDCINELAIGIPRTTNRQITTYGELTCLDVNRTSRQTALRDSDGTLRVRQVIGNRSITSLNFNVTSITQRTSRQRRRRSVTITGDFNLASLIIQVTINRQITIDVNELVSVVRELIDMNIRSRQLARVLQVCRRTRDISTADFTLIDDGVTGHSDIAAHGQLTGFDIDRTSRQIAIRNSDGTCRIRQTIGNRGITSLDMDVTSIAQRTSRQRRRQRITITSNFNLASLIVQRTVNRQITIDINELVFVVRELVDMDIIGRQLARVLQVGRRTRDVLSDNFTSILERVTRDNDIASSNIQLTDLDIDRTGRQMTTGHREGTCSVRQTIGNRSITSLNFNVTSITQRTSRQRRRRSITISGNFNLASLIVQRTIDRQITIDINELVALISELVDMDIIGRQLTAEVLQVCRRTGDIRTCNINTTNFTLIDNGIARYGDLIANRQLTGFNINLTRS